MHEFGVVTWEDQKHVWVSYDTRNLRGHLMGERHDLGCQKMMTTLSIKLREPRFDPRHGSKEKERDRKGHGRKQSTDRESILCLL